MSSSFRSGLFVLLISSHLTSAAKSQEPDKQPNDSLELLKNDPRLKAPVTYHFKGRPAAQELFDVIHKATGVKLSIAFKTDEGKVTLGTLSAKNTPAWQIMEGVAKRQVVDGTWEKTADGYILHGQPKPFGMEVLSPEKEKEQTAVRKKIEDAFARQAQVQVQFKEWHPLYYDERLRVKFTVFENGPKLPDLLDKLRDNTGLAFTLADNLEYHEPKFGYFQLPDTAAYTFMEQIQKKDLDDGRWVKTEDGYRLEGVSKRLRVPPFRFPWGWTLAGLGAALLAAGAVVLYRRRAKEKPSPPAPLPEGEGRNAQASTVGGS